MSAAPERLPLAAVPDGMGDADAELLARARELLARRYRAGQHEVATAFRLADDSVVTGLHVEATASRASVCAEAAALSAAVAAGEEVVAIVSVLRRPGGSEHLIEPCGVCAELLRDHAADARLWLDADGRHAAVAVGALLPFAHRRAGRMEQRP